MDHKDNAEPISLLTFLTCEMVTHDFLADRFTAVNIFSSIRCSRFPATVTNFCLFAEIVCGKGWNDLRFRIVCAAGEDPPLIDRRWIMQIGDPLEIRVQHADLGPIVFPRPGVYLVEVLQGEQRITDRRIVMELETREILDHHEPWSSDDDDDAQ